MAVSRVMRPLAIRIRQLNIVTQVTIHSVELTVHLRWVNIATKLEMFWMALFEDALTVQVNKLKHK